MRRSYHTFPRYARKIYAEHKKSARKRVGASGLTANQHFTFDMRIDNPALTAQVLVSSARAAVRLAQSGRSGAYTLIDVPPVLLLPGERIDNIGRLV